MIREETMETITGYYDGVSIQPLENINAQPNQKTLIIIMDEFIESEKRSSVKGIRGILSKYADPSLIGQEKGAWERAVAAKYGNV